MKNLWSISYVMGFLFLTVFCGCQDRPTLFREMSPTLTGVDFVNQLHYSDSLTVLEFEYMYNGAGVSVGDVNNDGLLDIYFTANMTSNRLYLNQGDWKFQDITQTSGLTSTGWSNGAVMVDINQDGLLDIYVSRGGPRGTKPGDRANLLYVNNGDLTFTESALNYGLANQEYGVQSTFFDYDQDGDLDVYLLTNALVNFNRNTSRPIETSGQAPSADKLFRNNGDLTFSEVSKEAGILIEGFGLGVTVCDLNEDQWPDIYVSNDFLTDDLLYINQGDGTFENSASKYLRHQTYNGMGNDVADYNNDGLVDIMVLDMLPEGNSRRKLTLMGNNYDEFQNNLSFGYQPQYIRNTLQLNNGNGTFSEIGQLAGIDATDWSWSALFADYDNDGLKDLLITNGYRQDVTNLDFMVYGQQALTMGEAEANKKLRLEALNKLEGSKVSNYIYRNKGDLTFSDQTANWGLDKPTYSNGGVYADLDNDGDLDLVINNIDAPALLYKNTAESSTINNYLKIKLQGPPGNQQGLGTKVWLSNDLDVQHQYYSPYRGYLGSVDPVMHFGLDSLTEVTTLRVVWPDGKEQILRDVPSNQTLSLNYDEAQVTANIQNVTSPLFRDVTDSIGANYLHRENLFVDFKLQSTLPHMHSLNGPGVAVGDVNADGRLDYYVGAAKGYPGSFFLQGPDGNMLASKMRLDSAFEDMGTLFFDADNDGDQDLYIASGGSAYVQGSKFYQDRLYLNNEGVFEPSAYALPEMNGSNSVVVAADYDQDGDLDLFVGGRVVPGSYPLAPQSYLLRNELVEKGSISFVQEPMDIGFQQMGMVTAALWTDFNNDGWHDLIVVGEFMPIRFFKNNQGRLGEITDNTGITDNHGWWNSLSAGDFDEDGDIDYLAGNLGLNSRFSVTPEEPLCIYAKDFDNNGRLDPIMCYFVQGENYIAHTRDDVIDQINAMRARFKTYDEYANSTFEQSFLPSELTDAYMVHSENFQSSYLENLGEGRFKIKPLAIKAQFAPIFGMIVDDYNEDGHLDALLVGNSYAPEVTTGRYDAFNGLYLLGDGAGNLQPISTLESGLLVDSDAKGLAHLVNSEGQSLLLVAQNNDAMKVYTVGGPGPVYYAKEQDVYAEITNVDGQVYRKEFYRGSGYLSNSGRFVRIHSGVQQVKVFNQSGSSSIVKADPL